MKRITAKELHQLVLDAQKDTRASYWKSHTISIQRSREVHIRSNVDRSFEGYGGWDPGYTTTEYYTEDETTYTLNLAELLRSNGYESAIYPLQFDPVPNRLIDKRGCTNLFDTDTFDDTLMKELQWCFENYYRLQETEIQKIIKRLGKKQLELLYQDDAIDKRCKDLIHTRHPECDPIRSTKTRVQTLYDQANSLKKQKKTKRRFS